MNPGEGAALALLEARVLESSSFLYRVRGPKALARVLAAQAGTPLWLEEHPWLEAAARELEKLGLEFRFARERVPAPADTVVSVALGAVAETGSVILRADQGAFWLAFQARKQIAVVPRTHAALSLAGALKLTRSHLPGMVSWLTGPTRTADIEKVLVLGAQGPVALDVVVYQPASGARR